MKFAEKSPEPPLEKLYDYTYVDGVEAGVSPAKNCPESIRGHYTMTTQMREITYRQALNEALAEELERDADVFLMGEEVAEYNGAYKVSQGLLERFGAETHHRHADQRKWFCRHGSRRGDVRTASDHRVHDLQFLARRFRSSREQRAEHAHDVGRTIQYSDHVSRSEWTGASTRRDALARDGMFVCECSRPERSARPRRRVTRKAY